MYLTYPNSSKDKSKSLLGSKETVKESTNLELKVKNSFNFPPTPINHRLKHLKNVLALNSAKKSEFLPYNQSQLKSEFKNINESRGNNKIDSSKFNYHEKNHQSYSQSAKNAQISQKNSKKSLASSSTSTKTKNLLTIQKKVDLSSKKTSPERAGNSNLEDVKNEDFEKSPVLVTRNLPNSLSVKLIENKSISSSFLSSKIERSEEEKKENPDSIHLEQKGLKIFPFLSHDERGAKFISLQHNFITKLDNVIGFSHLIVLDLYNNRIERILELQVLQTLKVLLLGKNRIRKMDGLENLKKLEILDLHGNQIRYADKLSFLSSLKILNLGGNKMRSLRNIGPYNLTSLTELNLRRNKIKSIEGLTKTPHLKKLLLGNNQLQSISSLYPLKKCIFLQDLLLDSNPLFNAPDYQNQILTLFPWLLFLDRTPVTDSMKNDAKIWQRKKQAREEEIRKEDAKNVEKIKLKKLQSRDEVICEAKRRWESVKTYVKNPNEKTSDKNLKNINEVHLSHQNQLVTLCKKQNFKTNFAKFSTFEFLEESSGVKPLKSPRFEQRMRESYEIEPKTLIQSQNIFEKIPNFTKNKVGSLNYLSLDNKFEERVDFSQIRQEKAIVLQKAFSDEIKFKNENSLISKFKCEKIQKKVDTKEDLSFKKEHFNGIELDDILFNSSKLTKIAIVRPLVRKGQEEEFKHLNSEKIDDVYFPPPKFRIENNFSSNITRDDIVNFTYKDILSPQFTKNNETNREIFRVKVSPPKITSFESENLAAEQMPKISSPHFSKTQFGKNKSLILRNHKQFGFDRNYEDELDESDEINYFKSKKNKNPKIFFETPAISESEEIDDVDENDSEISRNMNESEIMISNKARFKRSMSFDNFSNNFMENEKMGSELNSNSGRRKSVPRHIFPKKFKMKRGQTAKGPTSQIYSPLTQRKYKNNTDFESPREPNKFRLRRTNSSSSIKFEHAQQEVIKKQGVDYLVEIEGRTLSLYGQGALKHFLNGFPTTTMENINCIKFQFVLFDSICPYFSKLKQTFPSIDNIQFRANNISILSQLNALADIQGFSFLTVSKDGNPIVENELWTEYAIYRLGHWGLRQINGKDINSEFRGELSEKGKIFESLGYLALSCLPQSALSPLAKKLHSLQCFCCCTQSSSTEENNDKSRGRDKNNDCESSSSGNICNSWDDDPVLLDVIGKEALVYTPMDNENETDVKLEKTLSKVVLNGHTILQKLEKLDTILPEMLESFIHNILIDLTNDDNKEKSLYGKRELKKLKDQILQNNRK